MKRIKVLIAEKKDRLEKRLSTSLHIDATMEKLPSSPFALSTTKKIFNTKPVHPVFGSLEIFKTSIIMDAKKEVLESSSFAPYALLIIYIDDFDAKEALKILEEINNKGEDIHYILYTKTDKLKTLEAQSVFFRDIRKHQFLTHGTSDFMTKQIILTSIDRWNEGHKKNTILASLRNHYKKAKASAKIKQDLLSIIGHEFRTPLNVICLAIGYLKQETLSKDESEMIDLCKKSINRIDAMITDVLMYVAIDKENFNLDKDPISIRSLIESCYVDYQKAALEKGLEFHPHISIDQEERCLLDKKYFKLLICHLIDNAVKFTPKGEVRIKAELSAHEGGRNETLLISIKDSGIGIKNSAQEDIFETFYQVGKSKNHSIPGTGMGLAICQKIVTHMEGEISVESSIDKGSEFSIKLPFKRTA